MHYAGEKVYDIYDVEKRATEETYTATKKVLDDYFSPKKNIQIKIYNFRAYKQLECQTLDEFVTELRTLAKNCEFAEIDKEILQQVIQNCKSNQLRRRALREPDKNLDAILTLGRMLEQSEIQAMAMEKRQTDRSVNRVSNYTPPGRSRYSYRGRLSARRGKRTNFRGNYRGSIESHSKALPHGNLPTNKCRNCGFEFPHRRTPCPAKGKTVILVSAQITSRVAVKTNETRILMKLMNQVNYSQIRKNNTSITLE